MNLKVVAYAGFFLSGVTIKEASNEKFMKMIF